MDKITSNFPPLKLSQREIKKYSNLEEYKADILMGQKSEHHTLLALREILNDDTLQKSKGDYAILDFVSKKYRTKCEVKSRRNNKNTYPTTMLGVNKTDEAERLSKRGYTTLFFFDFNDGLYYFDYNDWDTITSIYSYERKMGGTYRRGLREWKCYNYIPVSALKKCEFYNGSISYTKTKRKYKVVRKKKSIENTKIEKV
jgi:hypothetical protein